MKNSFMLYDGNVKGGISYTDDEGWRVLSGQPLDSDNTSSLKALYQKVPWLYRGVELRAGAVASMPFKFYRGEREIDSGDDYQNVLGFLPDFKNLLWLVEACLTVSPACYLFSENVSPKIRKRLRYILPNSVEPQYSALEGLTGFKRYVDGAPRVFAPAQEIVYFWRADPYVEIGPGGAAPGIAALHAAGVLANVAEFVEAFFSRGAVKAMLFSAKGMSKEDAKAAESWWNRFVTGVNNAFRTRFLNAETVTPVIVGEGIEGLQNTELTHEQRQAVSTALGIPMTKLFSEGAAGLGGGGVVSQDDKRWISDTVVPECELIAGVLNEQVFRALGVRLEFEPESLPEMQEDENSRADRLVKIAGVLADPETFMTAAGIVKYDIPDDVLAQIQALIKAKNQRREEMAAIAAQPPKPAEPEEEPEREPDEMEQDMTKWQKKSLRALEKGKPAAVAFESDKIPASIMAAISGALEGAKCAEDVRNLFRNALAWRGYP